MSKPKHLTIAVCLLGSWLSCTGVGVSGDRTTGQIIGLCYRDGSKDVVLEEILQTEGVPCARLRDLKFLAKSDLKGLILGEGFDNSGDDIKAFLEKGGVALCLKPSGRLAETLGLKQVGIQKDGYLAVRGKGASLVSYEGCLQLFGLSNRYKGGENLASLRPGDEFGGIIQVKRGSGTALVVAFDLPATLLTILQPKSDVGAASDASNVEYELGDVPQVDLMRRLLVGLFLESLDVPMTRKWYFPSQHTAMMIPLGDQDGANFVQMKVVLELTKELDTPYTLYVTPVRQPITKEQFNFLARGGMEFALHPDFMSQGHKFIEEEFIAQVKKAAADVGRAMTGERPHACRWDSFREVPSWAERAGLQYESILGIKAWDSKPVKVGYWLGTGLPYRAIDPEGNRRLNFLEIPVAGCDNQDFWPPHYATLAYKPGGRKLSLGGLSLTEDGAFKQSKRIMNQAIEKYHTVYGYCWHPHYLAAKTLNVKMDYATDSHFRKCINYARSRGVGLIGANALNEFWRAREKVSIGDIVWNDRLATLQYKVFSEARVKDLTLIAPFSFHGKTANISVNAQPLACARADLFGSQYAIWAVDAGPEELTVTVRYDRRPMKAMKQ